MTLKIAERVEKDFTLGTLVLGTRLEDPENNYATRF